MSWKLEFNIGSNGFLPNYCEKTLPANFSNYLTLIENMASINFPELVEKMDTNILPDITNLENKYLQYLYSSLSIIVNKYIYYDLQNIKTSIPYFIGKLFYDVALKLDIKPVMSYCTNMWNWELIDKTKPLTLDNITIINTIINKNDPTVRDEEWFDIITLYIESLSANVLDPINSIYEELEKSIPNDQIIITNLKIILTNTTLISDTMGRLRDQCRSDVYWTKIRPYITGTNNKLYFPNGVKINNTNIILSLSGVSGAQSPLIQTFDKFLSIKHEKTSLYLDAMSEYMNPSFRNYIKSISKKKSLRDYINEQNLNQESEIVKLFNDCIKYLVIFRSKHLSILKDFTSKYVSETEIAYPVNFCSEMIKDYCYDKIK